MCACARAAQTRVTQWTRNPLTAPNRIFIGPRPRVSDVWFYHRRQESPIPRKPQQRADEIGASLRVLQRRGPCNFLVFGLHSPIRVPRGGCVLRHKHRIQALLDGVLPLVLQHRSSPTRTPSSTFGATRPVSPIPTSPLGPTPCQPDTSEGSWRNSPPPPPPTHTVYLF
jgi:hypothetical protein